MATATKKPRRPAGSMEFVVFQDNGGSYNWTITADDGATLARSSGFASHREAEQAAQHVRDNAAAALVV